MHKSWIKLLCIYTNIQDEKEHDMEVKKMIRKLIRRGDENCPPIDFDAYEPSHFLRYLLALQTSEGKRFGPSTYNSRRSALHHLYTIYGKKQSKNFQEELSLLFRSLKRRITEEKQEGDGRIQTGKSPISFLLYKRLNEYILKEGTTESVFARVFLCLTWNLICRSKNTTTIHLHHLEWSDDCLNIYFAHMKNDQLGDRKRDPRHIYANPIDPTVCPILALAIYFSIYSITGTKDSSLFPGKNQYKRFAKYFDFILNKFCEEIRDEFGMEVKDIGVHSLRKGAASFVSSGSTCAPPQVATNIRAGWTMGQIQDTYLRYESAGDQYVGCVVSGLPLCSPKFAVLPPQFDCCLKDSEEIAKIMFPSLPTGLISTGRFLSACLLFHLDFF